MQSNNPASSSQKAFTLIELLIVVAIIAILAAIAVPNFMEAQVRSKVSRGKSDMRSLATALEAYYIDGNSYPPCNSFAVCQNTSNDGLGGYTNENYSVLECLSTPVAYITKGIYPDAFYAMAGTRSAYSGTIDATHGQPGLTAAIVGTNGVGAGTTKYAACLNVPAYHTYLYTSTHDTDRVAGAGAAAMKKATAYVLASAGPDLIYINQGGLLACNSGTIWTGITAANKTAIQRPDSEKMAYCANLQYDTTNGTKSFGDIYRAGGNVNNNYGQYFYRAIPR